MLKLSFFRIFANKGGNNYAKNLKMSRISVPVPGHIYEQNYNNDI